MVRAVVLPPALPVVALVVVAPAAASAAAPPASGYGMATRLAHPKGKGKGDPYNASSPVLYQTATFELDPKNLSVSARLRARARVGP